MIALHSGKVLEVINKYLDEITSFREEAYSMLNEIDTNQLGLSQIDINYLNAIKVAFQSNDIILAEKDSLLEIINRISVLRGAYNKELKDKIVNALGYKNLRSTFYPKYFKELGINACVYCNSQLTIVARKNNVGELSAKFQLDHYYSQGDYPFLCISLFNLYPSCASCNVIKKKKEVDFDLYSRDIDKVTKSSFKFKLSPSSKIKYLTSKDSSDIKILFEEPNAVRGKFKFEDTFHISGIYESQSDLIEELIVKSQIYNASYLKALNNSFGKLSLNPSLFKRTIVGNYVKDIDVHKRPMSKVVMDIAEELGLIDDIEKTI